MLVTRRFGRDHCAGWRGRRPKKIENWAGGPLLVILTAVLVFGAYLGPLGLEGGVIGAVLLAGTAQTSLRTSQIALMLLALVCLGAWLMPGVTRSIGPTGSSVLLASAGICLLVHWLLYGLVADRRSMVEQLLLAGGMAAVSVIVFVDGLGLSFRSLVLLDLWKPLKASVVGLFRAVTGI